jgi:hypothetical protein
MRDPSGRSETLGADTSEQAGSPTGRRDAEVQMVATNVSRFEQFFRQAAGIDVDKNDLKRHNDFVDQKLHDLLLRGEANAKANSRDVIEVWDLSITKGCRNAFTSSTSSTGTSSFRRSSNGSPPFRRWLWVAATKPGAGCRASPVE